VKLLLDTHAWLWFRTANPRLGPTAGAAITDVANDVFVSVASAWEIGIKVAAGKLVLPQPFEEWVEPALAGFDVHPILLGHARAAVRLPAHHKDPFDRLLIAQALMDGLTLVTADAQIQQYEVSLLRADF
jgi:PIN domain nuclease of toxin-antitoxin system